MKKTDYHLISCCATAICGALLMLCLYSCRKFVNVGPPATEVESAKVFSNDQATVAAALGVYSNMGISGLYICSGGSTLYPALSADELTYNSANTELLSFQHDQVIPNSGTGIYTRLWVPAYSNIYNANAILEGIASSTGLSDSLKRQVKGEMLVVRALNYFYLAGFFGDVPLELGTDYQKNAVMARTPVAAVYSQLKSDLLIADQLLTASYPGGLNTRPNKWAADILLARICLYTGDWANASKFADGVINSGQYQLETDPNNVFLSGSAETILQFSSDYHNTAEASAFVPSSASSRPSYSISSFLLNAFETGDLRLTDWIGSNTVGGVSYYYPDKYKNRSFDPITEYEVVFRLAEAYLISAEAKAQTGDLNGALADVNKIRGRAGLPNVSGFDAYTVLGFVQAERRRELFCEWGHRWLDLKRTGKADSTLAAEKPFYWQSNAALYPLPFSELQANPALKQNPGY